MRLSSLLLSVLLGGLSTSSFAECHQVRGGVTSIPIPLAACVEPFQDFPNPNEPLNKPGSCLAIFGVGDADFAGVSQLTTVDVVGVNGGEASSPLVYEDEDRGELSSFTSQAVLTGSLFDELFGKVYTKDTGHVIGTFVGQILLIVGGEDDFVGASGQLAVGGEELGGIGLYHGEICLPDALEAE